MTARRLKKILAAALLAFAVSFVAGGALAHELDHQLHKQDVPCALHYYAGHLDGIATAALTLPTPLVTDVAVAAASSSFAPRRSPSPYRVRAPPRFL